jgi:hypothetical protein
MYKINPSDLKRIQAEAQNIVNETLKASLQ